MMALPGDAPSRRSAWSAGVLLTLLCCPLCAGDDETDDTPPQPVDVPFRTTDDQVLSGTYWASHRGIHASVAVLLHAPGGDRRDWKELPERLQSAGYAVVAFDQRKGLKPADFQARVNDLDVVHKFLVEEHEAQRLNLHRTVLIAADASADVALAYAARDAGLAEGRCVRGLCLLSPRPSGGLETAEAIKVVRRPELEIGVMVCVGDQDPLETGEARRMYAQLQIPERENKHRVYLDEYEADARGSELLGRKLSRRGVLLEDRLVIFSDLHVRDAPNHEWRPRRPRPRRR